MAFPYKIKTKWKEAWNLWAQETKKGRFYLFFCFLLALFLLFFSLTQGSLEENKRPLQTMDTYIPLGFVLVPIEVLNKEALSALLGPHGVVDLFLPNRKGQKVYKIAHHVKMLRAPLDPSRFAILVPEKEATKILKHPQPLFAVIQNPRQKKPHFFQPKKKKSLIFVDK